MKLEIIEKKPCNPNGLPPILFVHGASHGAWCWEDFYLPYFANAGWDCYALSISGHGKSEGRENLHKHTFCDYIEDVTKVIDGLPAKPILIAHSLGGGIAQMVMAQSSEKIAGVVLMAGTACPNGPSIGDILTLFRAPVQSYWMLVGMFTNKTLSAKQVKRAAFFANRITDDQAERYKDWVQPESMAAVKDMQSGFKPPKGKVDFPLLVTGSLQEICVTPAGVRRTGIHYEVEPVFFETGCHDLMVDPNWQESADYIEAWLQDQFLV